jgi:hypothetical protein
VFTNTNHPTIDATQVNSNFTYLDTGKNREGVLTGVTFASDGSATATVTYSTPFATATDVVRGIVLANYSGSDNGFLSYRIGSITASGFTLYLGGGQSGSTVAVHYSAIGH